MLSFQWNLASKAAVGATILTAVTMLVVGVISFSLAKRSIFYHTSAHLESVAELKSQELSRWLLLQRTIVWNHIYLGDSPQFITAVLSDPGSEAYEFTVSRVAQRVSSLFVHQPQIREVMVLDSDGEVVFAADASMVGVDYSSEEAFIQGTEGPYAALREARFGSDRAGDVLIAEPTPGLRPGVVLSVVDVRSLQTLLIPDSGLGQGGRTYLVQEGRGVLTPGVLLPPLEASAVALLASGAEERLTTFIDPVGVDVVARAKPVQNSDWTVAIMVPADEAFADVWDIRGSILLSMVIIGVVAALAAWRFGQTIAGPLQAVVKGARAIGAGSWDHHIEQQTTDEVGELADSFNQMARDLARSYGDIEQQRSTLEAVQASMTEGLMVLDQNGYVVYCNGTASALCQTNAEEIVGSTLTESVRSTRLYGLSEESGEQLLGFAKGGVDGGERLNLTTKGSHRVDMEISRFSIALGPDEKMTGILFHDVTEERELVRRRDAFVSTASHELRTPTTAVMGFAELLLQENSLEGSGREWLERIYRNSERMSVIVDDMLDISRIQSGVLSLDLQDLPVESVIEDAVSAITNSTAGHTVKVDVPAGISRVRADWDKLVQVLDNLLTNAIKYSPAETTITVSARHETADDRVVMSVADAGIGIEPEQLASVFAPFHRIIRSETEDVRGTGLGLSIARGLVELLGGEIWVDSELNKSTTFYFWVPVSAEPAVESSPNGLEAEVTGG